MHNFKIDDEVKHPCDEAPFKVVGIRKNEVEIEGDWSGGTHNVCQRDWVSPESIKPYNASEIKDYSTKTIRWTEQNVLFGLDYSSKKGEYKDFTFDIRYDYDGDSKVNVDCGCCLDIYFKSARIDFAFGKTIEELTNHSESYLESFLKKYKTI